MIFFSNGLMEFMYNKLFKVVLNGNLIHKEKYYLKMFGYFRCPFHIKLSHSQKIDNGVEKLNFFK